MADELGCEQVLAKGDRLLFARLLEAGISPCLLATLHDEGGEIRIEGIGMDLEHPVLGFAEDERERLEHEVGAEPDELRPVHHLARPHLVGERSPRSAVHTVCADHQIRVLESREIGHLVVKPEFHA